MTIATEITRLQSAKGDIKAAIEAKGVTVAPELTLDAYPAKIAEITTGGSGGEWTKPADWIDISEVADNEINLLVTEGSGFAFTCTVAGSGTFSVDWGDGTIDHNCTSGAVQQHIHTVNGTPWTATGGHTWKVRVYNATAAITTWKIARHTYTNQRQYSPLLWAVVGAQGLTDCEYMFVNYTGQRVRCSMLVSIKFTSFAACSTILGLCINCLSLVNVQLPSSGFGAITNTTYAFQYTPLLTYINMPESWGNVTAVNNMFQGSGLEYICLPASWGSVGNASYFIASSNIKKLCLPVSWGSVTNISYFANACSKLLEAEWSSGAPAFSQYAFQNCTNLNKITILGQGSTTNNSGFLHQCYSLREIVNSNFLGSITGACDFNLAFSDCENLQTPLVISSLLSLFHAYGAAGYVLKIPSIRLTNPGSTFTGSSPQINVSYTSLDATALENLFTDLPTLTGKTINITGCVGAASLTPTQREIATNKGWTIVG